MLIIPTYNERDNVAQLVSRIRKAAPSESIFFVDDNSPDGTAEEIHRIQQQDRRIRLLVRKGKLGYGSACRQAMQEIVSKNLADHVIQFDADLSHPPELLPTMVALLREYPVVVGSRYVSGGGTQNWSVRRRWLSSGANLYARLLTGVPVHDMTAGFVGYQTSVLRELDLQVFRSEGYAFLMEMKFNLHQRAVSFCEFPIVFWERAGGNSKFSRKIMLEGARFPLKAFWSRVNRKRDHHPYAGVAWEPTAERGTKPT
ncbi:MAG: polyprenol monophosphomannose synthase [Acidobacteriia bacterium]|nr:polyprenol monophosphomannose synthase [Terriglobia bacterium]